MSTLVGFDINSNFQCQAFCKYWSSWVRFNPNCPVYEPSQSYQIANTPLLLYNTVCYNTVFDITQISVGPIWSFITDFPLSMVWIVNMEIGLDPNNSVIKRLWCKCEETRDIIIFVQQTIQLTNQSRRTDNDQTDLSVCCKQGGSCSCFSCRP